MEHHLFQRPDLGMDMDWLFFQSATSFPDFILFCEKMKKLYDKIQEISPLRKKQKAVILPL